MSLKISDRCFVSICFLCFMFFVLESFCLRNLESFCPNGANLSQKAAFSFSDCFACRLQNRLKGGKKEFEKGAAFSLEKGKLPFPLHLSSSVSGKGTKLGGGGQMWCNLKVSFAPRLSSARNAHKLQPSSASKWFKISGVSSVDSHDHLAATWRSSLQCVSFNNLWIFLMSPCYKDQS